MIISNNISSEITMEQVPGETFLVNCLQKPIAFSINNKIVKRGKLLLFRRVHYFVQIVLNTDKNVRENFEIPIPFKVEKYTDDGLMYFDYRITSLNLMDKLLLPNKVSSMYYNKILELSVTV